MVMVTGCGTYHDIDAMCSSCMVNNGMISRNELLERSGFEELNDEAYKQTLLFEIEKEKINRQILKSISTPGLIHIENDKGASYSQYVKDNFHDYDYWKENYLRDIKRFSQKKVECPKPAGPNPVHITGGTKRSRERARAKMDGKLAPPVGYKFMKFLLSDGWLFYKWLEWRETKMRLTA